MVLQRFAEALRKQNWTTVLIEFLLVVAGVLIALELDRLNEEHKEKAEEKEFLILLREELNQDIRDVNVILESYKQVEEYGKMTLETLGNRGCESNCWKKLVTAFHASQWLDVRLNTAVIDEMIRRGLPKDPELKANMNSYYGVAAQRNIAISQLPRFREEIRSIIPHQVQMYIWENCFSLKGKHQYFSNDCPAAISEEKSSEIIEKLQEYQKLSESLTFWMSNVVLMIYTLPAAITDAEEAIKKVDESIPK